MDQTPVTKRVNKTFTVLLNIHKYILFNIQNLILTLVKKYNNLNKNTILIKIKPNRKNCYYYF